MCAKQFNYSTHRHVFITNIAFKLSLYIRCILFHVDASGGDNADLIATLIDVIVFITIIVFNFSLYISCIYCRMLVHGGEH